MRRIAGMGACVAVILATASTAWATPSPTPHGRPNPTSTASPRGTFAATPTTSSATTARPGTRATGSPTPSASITPPTVDAATLELQRQQKALAAESAGLAKAALLASARLQELQSGQRAAVVAAHAATVAAATAHEAARQTALARHEVRSYADALYRGGIDPRLLIVTAALSATTPRQFFADLSVAALVGNHRAQILEGVALAQSRQEAAARAAVTAVAQRQDADRRAMIANAAATHAVAAYRQQVASRRQQVAASAAVLQTAELRARNTAAAEAIAHAAGWQDTPRCAGQDVSGYPNGMIPLAALCPLRYAPGRRLRADAAFAFNTMAAEYAATYGVPLCVADSYRSLTGQIAIKAERPTLAADPGHSNHGWGLAVDLCGGIESFTSPAHGWMVAKAVLFGWFHPGWAEPSGVKPEPWHWEFAA